MDADIHTLAVDVMGSDCGPAEVLQGVVEALGDREDFRAVLVGDRDVIEKTLASYRSFPSERLEICHASEVIGMDEKPVHSLRTKKDASMVRAIELLHEGRVQAMLSCGNTGSLIAGSTLKLHTMPGVERPALATIIPTMNRYIVMADVGANPNTTPLQLVHNAILAGDYCTKVLQIPNPKIGLLTIGTEEGKGNEVTLAAHELLKKLDDLISYHGLIEGFQILTGEVDVVICDGFVGNVLLKTMESFVVQIKSYFREEFKKNIVRMLSAVLARGVLASLRGRLNPETYGAASLLGLKGAVLKSHGSSNHRSIRSAIKMAVSMTSHNAAQSCEERIRLANERIKSLEHPESPSEPESSTKTLVEAAQIVNGKTFGIDRHSHCPNFHVNLESQACK
ncbi:MAG: phosphate acyltransferase PlsX [Verrucomicrobiota bacterium]|nr:MAG: phosphate acyltransferase PlsX [Verrucomicrobiota bacterium]